MRVRLSERAGECVSESVRESVRQRLSERLMLTWYDGENTTKKRRRLGQMLVRLSVKGGGKGWRYV